LWIATGAGAVGRQQLGTVVIMGMGFDTLFASLLIPVSFYAIERLSRRREAEHPPVQQAAPATK
jgi:HAE1 family hydrophobic/amphiphilic exporter-1